MIVTSFNSLSNLASNSSQILNPFIKLKEHYLKIYHSGLSQAYPNPNILNDAVPQRRRAQVCHSLYLLHLRSQKSEYSYILDNPKWLILKFCLVAVSFTGIRCNSLLNQYFYGRWAYFKTWFLNSCFFNIPICLHKLKITHWNILTYVLTKL